MDLVSILVPVYGVEKFIEKCAVSLFEQTYPEIEYVFVDDCTPDDSIKVLRGIIEKYPLRKQNVHIVEHRNNRGLAAARNTAIDFAHGKYIMHVDSDDYLDLKTVEKAVYEIKKDNSDAVMFGMNHVFKNKSIVQHISIPVGITEYVNKLIRRECVVCICGALFCRSLYLDHGVKAVEGLNMGEDYATKPRLMYYAKKVSYIDEPLYNYVHYNTGSYTGEFSVKSMNNQIESIRVLSDFFGKVSDCNLFSDSLKKASLQIKAELLISWGLHAGKIEEWHIIRDLYKEYSYADLPFKYKMALVLSKYNLPMLIRLYSKVGLYVKQILKH